MGLEGEIHSQFISMYVFFSLDVYISMYVFFISFFSACLHAPPVNQHIVA